MARTAIHPGEHLAEELKAFGMSAAALSRDINVPVNRIIGIIKGTRAITADTAIRLGHWFGSSAEFWLNLQKLYELRRAHADVGAAVERLPSLGAILRERSTRPDEDAPPHVQPQIIPGSTKKMHETDYRGQHESSTERSPQASQAGNSKGTMRGEPHCFGPGNLQASSVASRCSSDLEGTVLQITNLLRCPYDGQPHTTLHTSSRVPKCAI